MKNGFQKLTAIFMTVLMFLAVIPVSAWGAERYSNSVVPGISVLSILPGDTNTITYIFQKKNGEQTEKIARQIVKKGDTLLEPEVKTGENEKFTGWDPAVTFGTVGEITETKTITVTAKIEKVYYIFFKDNTGRVVATKECTDGQTVSDFSDVTFPVGPDESITGWYFDEAAQTQKADSVTINGKNVTLYAKVEKGYWITFDANGGSYTAPVFYANGTAAAAPVTNPTLPGYSFDGWYLDKDCTNPANFSEITTSTTVYAGWKAADTTYTVIHWQENADDNGYSYAESDKDQPGASGAQTAARAKSYLGFTAQSITQETIAGDGSTIVNVYYKRNVYQVNFYSKHEHTYDSKKGRYYYGGGYPKTGSRTPNCGKQEGNWYSEYTITAKYGENISKKWPGGTWKVSKNGTVAQSNIDVMPLGGAEFYERDQGSGKAYYYLEDLNGNYVLDHTDTGASTSSTVTKEDRYDITGFTCDIDRSPRDGSNYNGANFYYTRNSYNVVYVSNGQTVNKASYKYEADISNAGSYVPTTAPVGKEDYVFAGWYADPTGQTKYDFTGKKMPANSITVYAKWVPPTYTVTLYDHDGNQVYALTIAKGAKLDESQVPTITLDEGETFLGWKLQDGTPFNLDTEINRNYELYAHVGSTKGYRVQYKGGEDTTGTAPLDDTNYAEGSYADVKLPGDLAKADKVFLGWATEATAPTKIYQPGDKLPIEAGKAVDGVITLYAVWGDKPVQTKLTYKANFEGAEPAEKVCELENNATVTILDYGNAELGLPTRPGYEFLGWSENPNATEATYKAGDKIIVDETDATPKNILYAIWKQSTVKLTVTKTVTGNFGDKSKAFEFSMKVDGGNTFDLTVNGTALAKGSQSDYTFSLKHGESIEIKGIPVGKQIVLAETNADKYGVKFGENDMITSGPRAVTIASLTADTEITVENDRNTQPDTGVFVDSLPYILIIACVAGAAALFLIRRRKNRED